MSKSIIGLVLSIAVLALLLTGCSDEPEPIPSNGTDSSATTSLEQGVKLEPTHAPTLGCNKHRRTGSCNAHTWRSPGRHSNARSQGVCRRTKGSVPPGSSPRSVAGGSTPAG